MIGGATGSLLPVDVVFHPSWWHAHYGLDFGPSFQFDPATRVESEQRMRQTLSNRFRDLGLGEADARPRPAVGPVHLAIGFLVQASMCEPSLRRWHATVKGEDAGYGPRETRIGAL